MPGVTRVIKILIVEDEKPINDLIEMNLTEAGYTCTCVYDGIAACDAVENERFDLVLLDIMLPGADGYEVLDYIKPMEIPVIFLTAKGSTDDKVKGLKLGADDYLTKPFEIVELLAWRASCAAPARPRRRSSWTMWSSTPVPAPSARAIARSS